MPIGNKTEVTYRVYKTLKDKDGNILYDENGKPRLGRLVREVTSEMRKKESKGKE